jgi:myosin heavy subunit
MFTLRHLSGSVRYTTEGWSIRNRDDLHPNMVACLKDARNPLVSALFTGFAFTSKNGKGELLGGGGNSALAVLRENSLSFQFRSKMNELIHALDQCAHSCVVCLNPSPLGKPDDVDERFLNKQLSNRALMVASDRVTCFCECSLSMKQIHHLKMNCNLHHICWQAVATLYHNSFPYKTDLKKFSDRYGLLASSSLNFLEVEETLKGSKDGRGAAGPNAALQRNVGRLIEAIGAPKGDFRVGSMAVLCRKRLMLALERR